MKAPRNIALLFLASAGCFAQTAQTQPTTAEINFFRFMLMSVGSMDHSPTTIAFYENSLVNQFGLSTQESATIHAAGQTLNTLLVQLRQSVKQIAAGKDNLSAQDATSIAGLISQRERLISTLASQILSEVQPATAARLRAASQLMATIPKPGPAK